jgi:hypothetical protein
MSAVHNQLITVSWDGKDKIRSRDPLFIYEKTGYSFERCHIRVRNGCPSNSDKFFGTVKPRGEQVLRRALDRDAAIDPEVVKREKRSPKR